MRKLFLSACLVGVSIFSSNLVGKTVKIINPKVGGIALDWCKTWGHGCGAPAANYYCRVKGYLYAVDFAKDPHIGYTKILKTGQICNANFCDSFKYITCKVKPVQFRRFHWPKYQGVALDWCYLWARNCGKKVADEYCKYRGYWKGALRYKKANNVGYTKIMRTGQICNANFCDSFEYIDCKK